MHEKERKSNTGAKPIDVVLMFKVLALQHLHNLSDARIEYQIRDRRTDMRFQELQIEARVPDAKSVWLFRERLGELKLMETLFTRFHNTELPAMQRMEVAVQTSLQVISVPESGILEVP